MDCGVIAHPARERHELVRLPIAFSSRAPGRSLRAVRDCHPRQSPRRTSGRRFAWRRRARSFSGLRLHYRFLQHIVRRAGTLASREPSSARGCRLRPRSLRVDEADEERGAMPSDDSPLVPLAGASPLSQRGRTRKRSPRREKEHGTLLPRAARAERLRVKGTRTRTPLRGRRRETRAPLLGMSSNTLCHRCVEAAGLEPRSVSRHDQDHARMPSAPRRDGAANGQGAWAVS